MPIDSTGTVTEVHADTRQILVDWDGDRSLILLTVDPFELLPEEGSP